MKADIKFYSPQSVETLVQNVCVMERLDGQMATPLKSNKNPLW